jgi:hypothetical protein
MLKTVKPLIVILGIGLVVSIVINIALVLKMNYQPAAPQESDQSADSLTAKLGLILQLPSEKPTVAKIEDTQPLIAQNPQFYVDARVGDVLFIFSDKAIIYRPTENKIVNFASINRFDSEE